MAILVSGPPVARGQRGKTGKNREKLAPAACDVYFQDEIVRVLRVFCNRVS
ncbi:MULTISPECIES: hypothetical protein [unclassified Burkholderia]|uniref:hypothetical protein n=1 Tax=unclassified Burkholderia TaxID=2613784 RepID=UPI000ADF6561|nr:MULTISPECIES: hypothetical protein [unclassified Burkholderia]